MKILYQRKYLIWIQVVLIVSIALISSVIGQDGFLSIDCGSDADYVDETTGITWVTDAKFILSGSNRKNITVKSEDGSPILNTVQSADVRYFDDQRGRDCYELPVDPQETYLLRGTFFYGNLGDVTSSPISFSIYLDNTYVYDAYWDPVTPLYASYWFEVIYITPRNTSSLCLVRDQGPAFISTLELRKLAKVMYSAALTSPDKFLYLETRHNCGPPVPAIKFLRYPNDTYDRIWTPIVSNRSTFVSNPNYIPGASAQLADQPPNFLMQNGWVYYGRKVGGRLMTFTSTVGPIYLPAYFQELDRNASASNVRGMEFTLNGNIVAEFNVSNQPAEYYALEDVPDTLLNFTFKAKNWSLLPPSLNGFEVYSIYDYNSSTTADEDVKALSALQNRLGWTNWTGDPCVPTPYSFDWLGCSDDVRPRITKLFLANYGLEGNIPQEILLLTALTDLELNDNSFDGFIPDFSSLKHLQHIYLQNNLLVGEIPDFSAASFPNLTRLALDNNNLTGTVPSDMNRKDLNLTIANNTDLMTPSWMTSNSTENSNKSSRALIGAVVGGLIGGLSLLAVTAVIAWWLCTKKRRATSKIIQVIENAENRSCPPRDTSVSKKALGGSTVSLSLQEISDATKKFSKRIGEGSFGPVYHGTLQNGQEVAVKVKSTDSQQGLTEFLNEVELLSRIHHRNLVSLVGFCDEGSQQILVYVYVSNGTLRDHLYGDPSRKSLDWRTRLDIALNAARGLEYLHTDCNPRIIHRDVKTTNILLGEKMVAKVADFGISKQTPEGIFSGVDTLFKGTPGYFDPEYFITQRLTPKSDVFSFGVVLLEIISGCHPQLSSGGSETLIQWVCSAATDGRLLDIVDPSLNGDFNEDSMIRVISLAVQSIDYKTVNRPDMRQVVLALTEAIDLELLSEIIVQKSGAFSPIAEAKEEDDPEFAAFNTESYPGTEVLGVDGANTFQPR